MRAAVELSYCADRCWIDCGEASPVRELELQPLLDASGVIAAQHAAALAEGVDLFSLPVTPPDDPAPPSSPAAGAKASAAHRRRPRGASYCGSPQWTAFVDACTGTAEAVHGFLALAARPDDCERLRLAALRVLAAGSCMPPSAGQEWIRACTSVLGELQRDLVQVYLQRDAAAEADAFAARRRCVFQYAQSELQKLGRSFDADAGIVAARPSWQNALEPMCEAAERCGEFTGDLGIVTKARSSLISCIQQGMRSTQAEALAQTPPSTLLAALDSAERELLPWVGAVEFPAFGGAAVHASVGLLALAEAYEAPALQSALGALAAVRQRRGAPDETMELLRLPTSFCAACQSSSCCGARAWRLDALKATRNSGDEKLGELPLCADVDAASDQDGLDPWRAVRSWSESRVAPKDEEISETASVLSAASDETFFSTLSLHSTKHTVGDDDDDALPRKLDFTSDQSCDQLASNGTVDPSDTRSILQQGEQQDVSALVTECLPHYSNGCKDAASPGTDSKPDLLHAEDGPANFEGRHDADTALDHEMEDVVARLCTLSEAALERDIRTQQAKGSRWEEQLVQVRRLRKQAVLERYSAMGNDDYTAVQIPFLLSKAALARINCEAEADEDEWTPAETLTLEHQVAYTYAEEGSGAAHRLLNPAMIRGQPTSELQFDHLSEEPLSPITSCPSFKRDEAAEVEAGDFEDPDIDSWEGDSIAAIAAADLAVSPRYSDPIMDITPGDAEVDGCGSSGKDYAEEEEESEEEGGDEEQEEDDEEKMEEVAVVEETEEVDALLLRSESLATGPLHTTEADREESHDMQRAQELHSSQSQEEDTRLEDRKPRATDAGAGANATVVCAQRRAAARAARRQAEAKAEAQRAQGGKGEALAARREALAKLEAAAATKRAQAAEAAKLRTRRLQASLATSDADANANAHREDRVTTNGHGGGGGGAVESPAAVAETNYAADSRRARESQSRRARERARVAAQALARLRNAENEAKAAREKSKWAKRDERLMLYKQARLSRMPGQQLARRASADHAIPEGTDCD